MDPEFCSETGNFGAEAVSGLRKLSPQLPGRRTEIAAAVIRKRGGHPKAVLFRHLTERDVRRPEHPLDPRHPPPGGSHSETGMPNSCRNCRRKAESDMQHARASSPPVSVPVIRFCAACTRSRRPKGWKSGRYFARARKSRSVSEEVAEPWSAGAA